MMKMKEKEGGVGKAFGIYYICQGRERQCLPARLDIPHLGHSSFHSEMQAV